MNNRTKWNCGTRGHSLTKLWFKDTSGRTVTLNGRDWKHDKSPYRDITIGTQRFIKYVKNNAETIEVAHIYQVDGNKLLLKYQHGNWSQS